MLRRFALFRKIRTLVGKEITAVQKRSYESFGFYEEMPKSKEYLSSDDSDSSVRKFPSRRFNKINIFSGSTYQFHSNVFIS